jgi:hypothetical protein
MKERREATDLALCRHEIERLRAKVQEQRAIIRRLRAELRCVRTRRPKG